MQLARRLTFYVWENGDTVGTIATFLHGKAVTWPGAREVVGAVVAVAQGSDAGRVGLAVEGLLVPLDVKRCAYYREVKAVTYHELAIREIEGGFEAVYIVDI